MTFAPPAADPAPAAAPPGPPSVRHGWRRTASDFGATVLAVTGLTGRAGGWGTGWGGFARPIGVHLDGATARLVQFGADPAAGPTAVAAVPVPAAAGRNAPDPDADRAAARAIRTALTAYGFRGRRAVGCLPAGGAVVQNLRLPARPADEGPGEFDGLVNLELADRLPFGPAEAEVRPLPPRAVRKAGEEFRETVVFAARRTAAARVAALLSAAGLVPVAVDAEPLAAFRGLLGGDAAGSSERAVVLYVGTDAAHVLLAEGPTVLLAKTFPGGSAAWDAAVARQTGLDARAAAASRAAAFAADAYDETDELHRSVLDALRGPLTELAGEVELASRHFRVLYRGAAAAVLRGGGPHCPAWLVGHLADHLGLPPLTPDPLGGPGSAGAAALISGRAGAWAAACGLARRPEHSTAGAAAGALRSALAHPLGGRG